MLHLGQLSLAFTTGSLIEYQLRLAKGGNVTSAGWQVTLCDPMWHVSSRSGVATLQTAIHLLLTYLSTRLILGSDWLIAIHNNLGLCVAVHHIGACPAWLEFASDTVFTVHNRFYKRLYETHWSHTAGCTTVWVNYVKFRCTWDSCKYFFSKRVIEQTYNLCRRPHGSKTLLAKTQSLNEQDFFIRAMYKHSY